MADLSDYSEDFEDDDSSKGDTELSKPPEVFSTPKRGPVSHHNGTDPGQRKARSQYYIPMKKAKNSWGVGKGRALSEKPFKKGASFSPRDRELSAKVHAIRKLQNQLADCQRELGEMKRENKLLTRLQIRQERELNKVQTQEGELPQILARHAEEVRVIKEQLKRASESSQMHEDKERALRDEVQKLKSRGKKLEEVAKRKDLLERESLALQLQKANEKIHEKERKLKELERGIETLNKTHGQEMKVLLVKNKTLTQELETAREKTQKLHTQLKNQMKEMNVMNIYSQRLGRNTLNTSIPLQDDTPSISTGDAYSQTDLSCAPGKNVSMQTKPTLRSSSSQTQPAPNKTLQTRTTQTEITPKETTRAPSPFTESFPAHTAQKQILTPPPTQKEGAVSPSAQPIQEQLVRSPPPEVPTAQASDEEQQCKNLLLSRLRALDSQKGPPASQPFSNIPVKTATEAQPTSTTSQTADKKAAVKSPPKVQRSTQQEEEARKKKLLLAKLMAIDDRADPQKVTESKASVTNNPAPQPPKDLSAQSGSSLQLWQADTVENLHKGKPAFFTEDNPFGSRSSSGKKGSGTLNATSGTKQSTSSDNTNILGYKPTFGRRARGIGTGPSTSLFSGGSDELKNPISSKATFSDVGESTPTRNRNSVLSTGLDSNSKANKDTFELFENESTKKSVGRDYPWEKRVNLQDTGNPLQGPANQSMVFGPKASLLPLRQKAEANRVDVLPGGLTEPDDLEELVL